MKFRDALKQLKHLSAEQRRVLETRTIFGKMRIARWLRLIDRLARFDARRDASVGPLKQGLWWIGILLVVVDGFVLLQPYPERRIVPVAIINAPFVVLLLWLFRSYRVLSAADLPNNLRLFVYPLLKVLAEETSLSRKVDLAVRLRGNLHHKNRISGPRKTTTSHRGRKTMESFYRDDWLLLDMQLADQTDFSLRITDMVRHRHIVKRNMRGKRKTKMKYKVATKIRADFRAPGEKEWISINELLISDDPFAALELRNVLSVISEYYRRRQSSIPLSMA